MTTSKQTKQERQVSFSITAPDAKAVMLAGDFNNWGESALPLQRGKNNVWQKNVTLRPGRYEYKFVVDGSWTTDPNNGNRSRNKFGSENSIIEVKK